MSLAISDDHRSLATVVRSVLADRGGTAAARAALDGPVAGRPPFWKDADSLGWLGLHVDERFGGLGFELEELVLVIEEFGRGVARGPSFRLSSLRACSWRPE